MAPTRNNGKGANKASQLVPQGRLKSEDRVPKLQEPELRVTKTRKTKREERKTNTPILLKGSSAWVEDKVNGGFVLIIQVMPPNYLDDIGDLVEVFLNETTCASPNCTHHRRAFAFDTPRISFEPNAQWAKECLVLQAIADPTRATKNPKKKDHWGVSKSRSYWFHVDCLEQIMTAVTALVEASGPRSMSTASASSTTDVVPLAEYSAVILPETRGKNRMDGLCQPGLYNLRTHERYAVERWTAVQNFNKSQKEPAADGSFSKIIGGALYLTTESVRVRHKVDKTFYGIIAPPELLDDEKLRMLRLSEVMTLAKTWTKEVAEIELMERMMEEEGTPVALLRQERVLARRQRS